MDEIPGIMNSADGFIDYQKSIVRCSYQTVYKLPPPLSPSPKIKEIKCNIPFCIQRRVLPGERYHSAEFTVLYSLILDLTFLI